MAVWPAAYPSWGLMLSPSEGSWMPAVVQAGVVGSVAGGFWGGGLAGWWCSGGRGVPCCFFFTSYAAGEKRGVGDGGGRRIIKK
ncbi:hypothetical protein CWI45_05665, partial [Neisseria meningitidis]